MNIFIPIEKESRLHLAVKKVNMTENTENSKIAALTVTLKIL